MPIIDLCMEHVNMRAFLLLSTFLLFFTGCQDRGYGTQKIDTIPGIFSTTPLTILYTTPKNSGDIAQRAYINIVFSATLDPTTLTAQSVHLKNSNKEIPIEMTIVNNLLYIKPLESLQDKVTYTLSLNDSITDFFGNALEDSDTFSYHCKQNFWKSVEAGKTHAMAQSTAGDLYMWGSNLKETLLVDPILYSVDMPFPIAEQYKAKDYSAGGHSSTIITETNSLVTTGALKLADTPERVNTASVGETHAVFVYDNRTLYSWGSNSRGELGNFGILGGTTLVQEFTKSEDWNSASTGQNFTLAIKNNGTLWGWGANDDGQLGINLLNERRQPTQEESLSDQWSSVSAGAKHALAIQYNGSLWSWGNNASGELGQGDNQNSRTAKKIGNLTTWKTVSAGANHSLALDDNGTLWTWGNNQHGQLGLNNTINKNIPVKIDSNLSWVSVSAGNSFSLGVKSDGTLWAWGYNFYDQLGLGQTDDLLLPTEVK